MPRAAIEKARAQAVALLERVVSTYTADVAAGEVGADGRSVASKAAPLSGRCPTGLMYGRIQSGKTVGMITFASLAIDNGFRVIVVLTSDNVKLVDQTASRFRALHGIIRSSTLIANWPAEANHISKQLSRVGLVVVCSKNQSNLAKLVDFLNRIGAADYPALIMDDEADQATPDTTENARKSGKPTAPKFGSAINRRTIHNDRPDEEGLSVQEALRHFVFLQVTATPYALLLQNSDNPLRPKFTSLLEPGEGYTGGESFFAGEHLDRELPPLVFVSEDESDELERGLEVAPAGLASALAFFLVSVGAQALREPGSATRAQNFLCHTSQKRMEHEKVSDLVRGYLDRVDDELRKPSVSGEIELQFEKAHDELKKTIPDAPPLADIVADLRDRLLLHQVIVINSDGANAEFSQGMNFIVGGNILGRGLTIENLLVTYYLRRAKVSQMDTMLQHARMFGYRRKLMPYTRVFLPERLALRFHRIHEAEQHLRDLLSDPQRRARIPVEVGEGLRATRSGVLDTRSMVAYTPGQHLYPGAPLVTKDAHKQHERAREATIAAGGRFSDERSEHEWLEISLDEMQKLVELIPYDPTDEDTWDARTIAGMLKSSAARFEGRGWL